MTSRRTRAIGLAIAGMVAIVSVVAACGGNETTTTVPSVTTTTLPSVSTTTVPPATTTTVPPATTTTVPRVSTTTLPPVTTTQSSTTTTKPPAPPTITALSPKTGPVAGGTSVVITGTGFTGLSGAAAVTFGGVNATSYTVNSATKITAKAPAHAAGSVQVKVTTSHGATANTAADDYTYVAPPAPPTITALSPKTGPVAGGTSVVITGTGFTGLSGTAAVTFGGVNAISYTVNSATKITAKAPAHAAGAVQVKVTTPSGATANTAADDYTYVAAPPTITALNPKSGPIAGGTSVVITGTGFTGLSGAAAVTFGGVNATSYTVNSATKITAKAPAHAAGSVQVKVTTSHGATADTAADNFAYVTPPTITALSPTTGPTSGGTSVVITGTGFTGLSGTAAVTFGGVNATSYTVDSATKITAKAPAHAAGAVQVKVTTPSGATADTAADNFTYVAPSTITAVSPTSGPAAGGSSVVITGTGFVDVTKVLFGDTEAEFTVGSPTAIDAITPPASPGTVQVKVFTAFGISVDTAADEYTYVAGPTVTALSPTSGPAAGGTSVVITGTSFVDVIKVFFGDTEAEFTVESPTGITAIAPPGSPGTVQVKVATAYGVSADTAADDYTYSAEPPPVGLWDRVVQLLRELFPQ